MTGFEKLSRIASLNPLAGDEPDPRGHLLENGRRNGREHHRPEKCHLVARARARGGDDRSGPDESGCNARDQSFEISCGGLG